MRQVAYLADLPPYASHCWGNRGTPMTMAAYLGGDVRFGEATVWVEPVVEDWDKFPFEFNIQNPWVQRSLQLMKAHVRLLPDGFLPFTPDYGDALTVFSLLRGTERLLLDLVEQPDVIERKVREYVEVWIKVHRHFWDIYRTRFPGDCSYLGWAPGRTYICQSDFSTMISPAMFERFVVPEIVRLGEYLEYMPWHLDGPEEIKHLNALLALPQIKAIQIQPGANRPPCVSPLWLPQARKIQACGRSLIVYANTVAELETLMDNLAPEGLCIGVFLPFTDSSQVEPFLQAFERRYG
jgi:5-methyltetrahydrofolate--homocysteine methyltransferase